MAHIYMLQLGISCFPAMSRTEDQPTALCTVKNSFIGTDITGTEIPITLPDIDNHSVSWKASMRTVRKFPATCSRCLDDAGWHSMFFRPRTNYEQRHFWWELWR